MSASTDRSTHYLRQMEIADPAKFKYPITILGVGAAGSVSCIALAKMGVPHITPSIVTGKQT